MTRKSFGLSFAVVFAATLCGIGSASAGIDVFTNRHALKSGGLADIRREAFTFFPRGSRSKDAADRLADMGFLCSPMPRALFNVSGADLICESNGRGFPEAPAMNVTLLTRNGLISDIEIWNIMDRADSSTEVDEE